jgi:toxin ParE1/3/4
VKLRLHPRARIDLDSAAGWYDDHAGRHVAADFVEAYAQAAELLLTRPEIGRLGTQDTRSIALRRYPFSLVYRADEEFIFVVAVAHWRRHPMFWSKRR